MMKGLRGIIASGIAVASLYFISGCQTIDNGEDGTALHIMAAGMRAKGYDYARGGQYSRANGAMNSAALLDTLGHSVDSKAAARAGRSVINVNVNSSQQASSDAETRGYPRYTTIPKGHDPREYWPMCPAYWKETVRKDGSLWIEFPCPENNWFKPKRN
jgi:hypothetical protein